MRIGDETGWPDPVPDHWLAVAVGGDPADGFLRHESVGLAFMAVVQLLPPRQRAILVLRDVLEWPAADVAEALETTSAAVNSGLQRARAAIRGRLPADWSASISTAAPADVREVARRYLDAWERADTTSLARLLTGDARMAMPPDPRTFEGRAAIVGYLETAIFSVPAARRISLQPTVASGQPAFVVLEPDGATGEPRPIGLMVLTVQGRRVAEIHGYMRADLAARFDESQRPAQRSRGSGSLTSPADRWRRFGVRALTCRPGILDDLDLDECHVFHAARVYARSAALAQGMQSAPFRSGAWQRHA